MLSDKKDPDPLDGGAIYNFISYFSSYFIIVACITLKFNEKFYPILSLTKYLYLLKLQIR